jgi:hypothetical protein
MCSPLTTFMTVVLCLLACCNLFVAGQGTDDNPLNLNNYPAGQRFGVALMFVAAGNTTHRQLVRSAFDITFGAEADAGHIFLMETLNLMRTCPLQALERVSDTTELRETARFEDAMRRAFGEGYIGNVQEEVFHVLQHHRINMGAGLSPEVLFRRLVHDAVTRFEGTDEAPTDEAATTMFTQPMLNFFVDNADLMHPEDLARVQQTFAAIATTVERVQQCNSNQLSWAQRDSASAAHAKAQKDAAQHQNARNCGGTSSSSKRKRKRVLCKPPV